MNTQRPVRASLLTVLLLSLATTVLAQEQVHTIEFYSPAVDRTMKYNIVLPPEYESSNERYPVLYLLHGLTQSYTAWGNQGVPDYGEIFDDLIVVMPDGFNSWYINYAESAGGETNNWEDHIVQDVVGHVDGNYRTIARREGRAITGLSMGGYGGLTLGLRNPDMFVSIGSTSGAISYGRDEARRLREGRPPRTGGAIRPRAASQTERNPQGQQFLTAEDADAYDPFVLIHQVSPDQIPHIYLDSGTEDGLIAPAREFAMVLFENDIPFDFMQMPGGHNGTYWTQSVGHIMSIQYEVMRRALGERPSRQPRNR